MHVETIAIENFKSFLERQELEFQPGFNLLVGANNAGKTSVLDVLDMNGWLNEPHRSVRTIPNFNGKPVSSSSSSVRLASKFSEFRQRIDTSPIYLPLPYPTSGQSPDVNHLQQLVKAYIDEDATLSIQVSFSSGDETSRIQGNGVIDGYAKRSTPNEALFAANVLYPDPNGPPQIQISNWGGAQRNVSDYYGPYRAGIYRFNAQRRPGFECAVQVSGTLDREATNLPYCINHLQTNDAHGHKLLCDWMSRVFPSIKWIQAPPTGANFELRCLSQPPSARREDLATPMGRMGAGVGNVLAMLYVVLVSRAPQVIAIDEPNAFLHPRALRELLAIMETEGKQHQFILTAHSADVLTSVNARSISLLEFDGISTTVKQVNHRALHEIRGGLADLGIRMTDLHAKDCVLWVEGQTEELVMPELLRWACPEVAAGTAVLRVERTGTFSSKKGMSPEEIVNIYERLSSSSALVPPMVCILLDGESLEPEKRAALTKQTKGKLRFLDRRMLENYLFHPEAINAALIELEQISKIEDVIEKMCKTLKTSSLEGCFLNEDGAKVISEVFCELSNATLEFRKTRDVPALVSWILENDPHHLDPLRECLRRSFGLPRLTCSISESESP